MEEDHLTLATAVFDRSLACVVRAGFEPEIAWARSLSVAALTEEQFLRELAWCILNAGMRERVVRGLFPRVAQCFWNFASSDDICATADTCVGLARRYFNHEPKLRAIVAGCERIRATGGFEALRRRLAETAVDECGAFPYIGSVTRWHLARNVGADCAKPDRHLVRLAQALRFEVQDLCAAIADARGERVGVVDLVLWRHAEMSCSCAANLRPTSARRRRRHGAAQNRAAR